MRVSLLFSLPRFNQETNFIFCQFTLSGRAYNLLLQHRLNRNVKNLSNFRCYRDSYLQKYDTPDKESVIPEPPKYTNAINEVHVAGVDIGTSNTCWSLLKLTPCRF